MTYRALDETTVGAYVAGRPALAERFARAASLVAEEVSLPKTSSELVDVAFRSHFWLGRLSYKEMCALLTAHDADPNLLGFWAVSGPEIGYVFVIPLQDGFSSMKQTHENWMVTIES